MTSTISTEHTSRVAPIGALTAALAAGLPFVFAHDWNEIAVVVALVLVVSAGVFGLVVPRALRKESAGGTALALAIPALLLTPIAFWSGLPLVLGVAGMVVGNAGRTARTGAGTCIVATVLGALAVLGYLSIHVMEGFAGQTGFLLS